MDFYLQASGEPYSIETQSLARIPTVFRPPSLDKHLPRSPLTFGERHHSDVSDIIQATQTLPRGTALARAESSIAFSSIFNLKAASNHHVEIQADGIEGSVEQMTQLLDNVPISSAPRSEPEQASAIIEHAQVTAGLKISGDKITTLEKAHPPGSTREQGYVDPSPPSASVDTSTSAKREALSFVDQQNKEKNDEASVSLPGSSKDTKSSAYNMKTTAPTPISPSRSDDEGELECDCGNNDDSE